MAVTINEFEVIPEMAPPTQGSAINNDTQKNDEPISLEELDEMLKRDLERVARLWAH